MDNLLKIAYKAMDDKLAEDLVVLDFRKHSPFVDYFIIGSANNERKAKSIIENIEEEAIKNGFDVKHSYIEKDSKWFLIDLNEVVCHVFINEERELYNLEGLWKDLPIVQM